MATKKGAIRRATEKSVKAAEEQGVIDPVLSAGPISALYMLCDTLDDPDFPVIKGKYDNVSIPTYLKGGKLAKLRAVEGGRAKVRA